MWIENRIKAEARKHKELEWAKIADKKIVSTIMEWCYKHNTIEFGQIKLCTTDGGWVNVIKLREFLEGGIKDVHTGNDSTNRK